MQLASIVRFRGEPLAANDTLQNLGGVGQGGKLNIYFLK